MSVHFRIDSQKEKEYDAIVRLYDALARLHRTLVINDKVSDAIDLVVMKMWKLDRKLAKLGEP